MSSKRLASRAVVRTRLLVLVGVFMSSGGAAHLTAQEHSALSGVVLEEGTDRPLHGATVAVVGSGQTRETGTEGEFLFLEVPVGDLTLRVSLDGYASLVEPIPLVEGSAFLQLRLLPLAVAVEEIIATVPGSSAQTASGARPASRATNDPRTAADLLQGRVAGLSLNRNEGSAGGGARVQTRGINSMSLTNEPVFYVNGIRVSGRVGDMHVLETIPASWVTLIRVLRGPSAQYPDAFNGAVLIETDAGGAAAAP
jgi:hypothetical protein